MDRPYTRHLDLNDHALHIIGRGHSCGCRSAFGRGRGHGRFQRISDLQATLMICNYAPLVADI